MSLSPMSDEVQCSPPEEDCGLNKVKHWRLKLCWLRQTCFLTDKQLWGRQAYYGVRIITGLGTPVYDHYWIERNEFLVWQLKRG
jgi:hypothetical protein